MCFCYVKHYCPEFSNVQTNRSKNILQTFGKNLHSFALIFLILVIWQFSTFRIPSFLSVIFAMVVAVIFILFIELIFNIYIKLTCIMEIFINFLITFLSFFCVLLLGYFLFSRFGWFFSMAITLLLCNFGNILHVSCFFFTNSNDYNLLKLIKMLTSFKVIITTLWMIYGYFLQPWFFSCKFDLVIEVK